ncbi:MAG: aa3-type cytochrome c oxidase subunit IV [Litorimonas sp.]
MASGHSNHTRGKMPVQAQSGTFAGFMNLTVYGACALVVILLMPILIFAVNVAWFPALIASFVMGVVLGLIFKLKGGWYVSLVMLSILAIIMSVFIPLLAN